MGFAVAFWLVCVVPVVCAAIRFAGRDDRRPPRRIPISYARPSRPRRLESVAAQLRAEPLRHPTQVKPLLPAGIDEYVRSALAATRTRLPTSVDDEVTELFVRVISG